MIDIMSGTWLGRFGRMRTPYRAAVSPHPGASRKQYVSQPEPRLFDQPTAAAYLGISERLFEKQWRTYMIPYPLKIGRRCLWDRKILDQWVDRVVGSETVYDPVAEQSANALRALTARSIFPNQRE